MRRSTWSVTIVTVSLLALIGCQSGTAGGPAEKKLSLDSDKAKVGYSIGFNMGQSVRDIKDEIELDALVQGLRDAVAGDDQAKLSQEAMRTILGDFQKKAREIFQQKQKASGEKNKAEGDLFLADNAKKPGVVTTASGLQYRVITAGSGPKPKATDTVRVHYRGTLINGTEFDSSYKRNAPVTFPLNRVIPAWTEGVQLMPVGSKYMFFVPSQLAYGDRGAGQTIGPNSVLIFEVELLGIEKPAETPPAK